MQRIYHLLLATRPINMGIMVLTLCLAYAFLILPVFEFYRMPVSMGWFSVALLSLSVTLIAAGGNILNDHYDVATDAINKPGKNKIGADIPEWLAWQTGWGLMFAGVAAGSTVALINGLLLMSVAFIAPVGMLWWYNERLKGKPVVGNLMVAALVAYVFVVLALLATADLQADDALGMQVKRQVWCGLGTFAVFAFLTTWIRELIKDIQDMQGDRKAGHRTLPILIGERTSRFVVIILLLLLFRLILIVQQWYLAVPELEFPLALAVGTELPLLACIVMVWRAKTPTAYGHAGQVMKLLMLGGILSMICYELLL